MPSLKYPRSPKNNRTVNRTVTDNTLTKRMTNPLRKPVHGEQFIKLVSCLWFHFKMLPKLRPESEDSLTAGDFIKAIAEDRTYKNKKQEFFECYHAAACCAINSFAAAINLSSLRYVP